jgi:hypothetical protein
VTRDAYGYGYNNPTTFSDPSGLEPCGLTTTCTGYDFEGPGTQSGDGKDGGSAPSKPHLFPGSKRSQPREAFHTCATPAQVNRPHLPDPGPTWRTDGASGKGPHSWHQAAWCMTRGAFACGAVVTNSRTAEAQAARWRNALIDPDQVNAMMHAYWFALNSFYKGDLGLNASDLTALGPAHESDWRDNGTDEERDLNNHQVGIAIGSAAASEAEIVAAVERALANGRLFCVEAPGPTGYVHACG